MTQQNRKTDFNISNRTTKCQDTAAQIIEAIYQNKELDADNIKKHEPRKLGRMIAKQIANTDYSKEEKQKLSLKIKKAMALINGEKNIINFGTMTRNEQLQIVADEYVKAAQEEKYVYAFVKKSRILLLKPNKEKYKGAINFESFSAIEIKKTLSDKLGKNDKLSMILFHGLNGLESLAQARKEAKAKESFFNRSRI